MEAPFDSIFSGTNSPTPMGDYLITTGGSDCFMGTYLWLACVQPQSVVGTPVRGHSHHGGDKDVVRSVSSIWSILFVWFVWSIWEDRSRGLSPSRRDQNVECLLFNVELIGMKYGSSRLRKHSIDVLRPACMVFGCSFLRSDEELGWRDIDWHLPHGGQTS